MNCRAVGLVFDDLCAVRQNVDTRFGLLPVKNAATGERVDSLCGSRGARHFGDAAGAGGDEVERYDLVLQTAETIIAITNATITVFL